MMEEADRYSMKYSKYPPYEILSTDCLSYEEVIKLKKVEAMVDKYYNSQKFNTILRFIVNKYNKPFDFYIELGDFFEKKGYFDKNIGNTEYYRVFIDFNNEVLKGNEEYLRDIIRYDYLRFNKKRGIPEFIKYKVSKEVEEKIKEKYRDKYSFREYSIEKFNIDVEEYIKINIVKTIDVYYLVDNENSMVRLLL